MSLVGIVVCMVQKFRSSTTLPIPQVAMKTTAVLVIIIWWIYFLMGPIFAEAVATEGFKNEDNSWECDGMSPPADFEDDAIYLSCWQYKSHHKAMLGFASVGLIIGLKLAHEVYAAVVAEMIVSGSTSVFGADAEVMQE